MHVQFNFLCNFLNIYVVQINSNKEDGADSTKLHSAPLLKHLYKVYEPEQSLCDIKFDTKYHKHNHKTDTSNSDTHVGISQQLLDAFCNDNVVSQIVDNLFENK